MHDTGLLLYLNFLNLLHFTKYDFPQSLYLKMLKKYCQRLREEGRGWGGGGHTDP